MPDFMLPGIDGELAERIKTIARDRKWALNDVILHLLRQALGLTEEDISSRGMRGDIATLGGTWAADEAAAVREALQAFETLPADELPLNNLKKPPA